MKIIAVLLIFTVITVKAADDAGDRIVGGQTAIPAQFPHQVSLRTRNGHFCGGSILNSNTILTAAHCVYGNNPQDFYVVVGTNSLYSGGTSYYVSRLIWHSNYNPQFITNDVAIVKLQRNIQFNQFTRPIALPTEATTEGQELILSGWGLTSFPGNIPSQLQFIRLHSLDLSQCSQQLEGTNPITGSHVCTESMGVGFGACRGDSGGPLIDQNQRQVGIVSWGVPCAKGYPDVFTSVYYYKRWIESNM